MKKEKYSTKKEKVDNIAKSTDKGLSKEIKTIAAKLKKIRIEKGYTNYETYSYDFGLSRALYGRYEKGQDMRISSLIKILKAVEVPLSEFFAEGFD